MPTPRSAAPAPQTNRRQTARPDARGRRSGYASRVTSMAHTLRGWACAWPMRQHAQTAAGELPDSVRFSSLHFAPRRLPRTTSTKRTHSPARRPLCFVPFRCLKPAETGRRTVMLAALARVPRIVLGQAGEGPRPRYSIRSVRRDGMKERQGATMLASFPRCASGRPTLLPLSNTMLSGVFLMAGPVTPPSPMAMNRT